MKHVLAIVLICLPAQLSAGGRCPYAQSDRAEVARVLTVKSQRPELARVQKIRPLRAWQRSVLFEMQIL